MKICVVGAGVIGPTTARALLRRGHQVILVDAAARRASADLLALAFFSRDQLALLRRELALDFDFRDAGKLVLLSGAGALGAASRQVDWQRRHGCRQQVLGRDACIGIEPALAAPARHSSGAVHTPSEQVGDCLAFCQGLDAALALRHASLRRVFSTVATGAVIRAGRVRALRRHRGRLFCAGQRHRQRGAGGLHGRGAAALSAPGL
ncbi:MAG TPA: hypothetical protein DCW29_17475 [Janthinobacterium sp.]|nr:hypothetical protein [Janthinobacterium sp.]